MLTMLLLFLVASIGVNMAMFVIAYKWQTDTLTDISYAASFCVVAVWAVFSQPITVTNSIAALMVLAWASRLGTYLLIRIHKMGRDNRFDAIRHNAVAFGKFWLAQGFSVWIIMIPAVLLITSGNTPDTAFMIAGVAIWALGLLVEAVADWQKYHFITTPSNKGKWIQSGVWRYSRHPNYLGEILVWVGVYIFCVSALTPGMAVVALIGPAYITLLLLSVSGIPPLEKSADARWGKDPAYQAYKKRTRVLLPLPRWL